VTTNHILAVEFVTAAGRLLWSGDGTADAVGYDITGLLVGSEGTFGPVTQALVRLTPLPEAVRVVMALFPSVIAAAEAVSAVIAAGMLPTSLEVMDHWGIRAVNSAYALGLPEAHGTTLLIIEVDGLAAGLDEQLDQILQLCRANGAFDLRPARDAAEQARVWAARKSFAGAVGRLAPAYYLVDTSVPRTRLPEMMAFCEELRLQYGMEVCNVFHAGDGNLHPLVMYDPRDADQRRRAQAIAHEVLKRSIAVGGVISGEHGIGLEKRAYLPLLFSAAELQLHAAVHQIFNPAGLFNPAKIFPADQPPAQLAAERRRRLMTVTAAAAEAPSPGSLVLPPDEAALAQTVAACAAAGRRVLPSGGRRTRHPAAVTVSTAELRRVLTYEPADLTIMVEAGMTLAELQAVLAPHNQWLPLLAADPALTLGELVATAADSPLRAGYGTLRDWLLALRVVEADGTLVRLGAQVVKNVTGYDLVKLLIGSRGTLGVITALALKVAPLPPARATLQLTLPDAAAAAELITTLRRQRVPLSALEAAYHAGTWQVLAQAHGHPAAVAEILQRVRAAAPQLPARELHGEAEDRCWQQHAALLQPDDATWLFCLVDQPARNAELLADVAQIAGIAADLQAQLRSSAGSLWLRFRAAAAADVAAWHAAAAGRWAQCRLHAAPHGYQAPLPRWGSPPPTRELIAAIKQELDPRGVFAALWDEQHSVGDVVQEGRTS
jgi:D-lactate dehydrogenase (cytochrome)